MAEFSLPANSKVRKDGRVYKAPAGAKKVREEEGIVYRLSGGRLSRAEMTEQCVSMALIPWLNVKLYGFA